LLFPSLLEQALSAGRHFDLLARWDGQEDIVWPEDAEGTLTLDVMDVRNAERIARLQGDLAARIFLLMRETEAGHIPRERYNCFNAVRYVLARTPWHEWEREMPEQGRKMDVQQALLQLPAPFVFQIVGGYSAPDASGFQLVPKYGALHAGLVLGADRSGEPVVFEKDTRRMPEVRVWEDTRMKYFDVCRADYTTCFPPEELGR
jgi:hypothetical protein